MTKSWSKPPQAVASLPVKRPRGRPRDRHVLPPEAVQRAVFEAFTAHGISGVAIPQRCTMKAGAATMVLQGIAHEEVGRRLGITGRRSEAYCSQFRKDRGITNDQWKAAIADNVAARRGGGRGSLWRGAEAGATPVTAAPARKAGDILSDEEVEEVLQFVHDVAVGSAMLELHAQGQTHVTREDVEKMSDARIADLLTKSNIREATARIQGGRGASRW